jgi:hypothetical protein
MALEKLRYLVGIFLLTWDPDGERGKTVSQDAPRRSRREASTEILPEHHELIVKLLACDDSPSHLDPEPRYSLGQTVYNDIDAKGDRSLSPRGAKCIVYYRYDATLWRAIAVEALYCLSYRTDIHEFQARIDGALNIDDTGVIVYERFEGRTIAQVCKVSIDRKIG